MSIDGLSQKVAHANRPKRCYCIAKHGSNALVAHSALVEYVESLGWPFMEPEVPDESQDHNLHNNAHCAYFAYFANCHFNRACFVFFA